MGENGSVSRYCHRRYRRQYRLRYRRRFHHCVRKGRVISAALRGTETPNRVFTAVTIAVATDVTTAITAAVTAAAVTTITAVTAAFTDQTQIGMPVGSGYIIR